MLEPPPWLDGLAGQQTPRLQRGNDQWFSQFFGKQTSVVFGKAAYGTWTIDTTSSSTKRPDPTISVAAAAGRGHIEAKCSATPRCARCGQEHGMASHRRPVEGRAARTGQACNPITARRGDCRGSHFAQANVFPKKRGVRQAAKGWRSPPYADNGVCSGPTVDPGRLGMARANCSWPGIYSWPGCGGPTGDLQLAWLWMARHPQLARADCGS